MAQRTNNTMWKWVAAIAIIAILGGMTFLAGFGVGFGTGRVTAPQLASAEPNAYERTTGPSFPDLRRNQAGSDLPGEYDLIWEAWDALEEDFYGDLPDTPEMVGGLVTGMLKTAEREADQPLDRKATTNALMAAVNSTLQEQYGALPDASQLSYGAIDGITFLLNDDYTSLMDPETATVFNEGLSGSFEGIGARVDTAADGGVEIIEPFEGQPAWNAGIRRHDVILAVDGVDVTDMPLGDAIQLIRGPKGAKVTLLVQSPDQEPRDVVVTRDRISIPVVEYEMLDNNIGYIYLGEFSTPAARQVNDALDDLLKNNDPTGLILDLRGNPGGFLRTAVDISSEFVPDGLILIERFKDGKEQDYPSNGRGSALEIPLVVLVNQASASASEILAGAVQDSGRGILIGETTFGKGSVQIPHELSDGSLLRVTTARWFTPNGQEIHGKGLTPDIEVELTPEDLAAGDDLQRDRAIEYLLTGQ